MENMDSCFAGHVFVIGLLCLYLSPALYPERFICQRFDSGRMDGFRFGYLEIRPYTENFYAERNKDR